MKPAIPAKVHISFEKSIVTDAPAAGGRNARVRFYEAVAPRWLRRGLSPHRLTHNKISKSSAKKITMMTSNHNIRFSFTSAWTTL